MNHSEKQRKELLHNTRLLYSTNKQIPAIHPRYRASYGELYGREEERIGETFGLRLMICFLLFAAFAAMDYREIEVANVESKQIVNEIQYQPDIEEVWKRL